MTWALGAAIFLSAARACFGLGLLDHPDDGIQHDDDHDGDRVDDFAQKQGNHGGHDQDDDQEVVELV